MNPSKDIDIKTPEDMVNKVKKMVASGSVATSEGRLSRGWFERQLGLVHGTLRGLRKDGLFDEWKDFFDKCESELIKEEGSIDLIKYKYGTPKRLKELLDYLREEENWGQIPAKDGGVHEGKLGHLNIRAFWQKYGLPVQFNNKDEWSWAVELLAEFNDEMYEKGAIGTTWERKVPGYRKILEELDEKKELPVNQKGRLNMQAFMTEYAGIADNISVDILCRRAPKLKKLFKEYDKKLEERGVTAYTADKHIDKLKDLLENGEYELLKDKKTINRVLLVEKLDINAGRQLIVATPSLLALVVAEEKKILESRKRGKTKKSFNVYGAAHINMGVMPYSEKHGKIWDFSELEPVIGLELTEKIATTFIVASKKIKSPKAWFRTIKAFMCFLSEYSEQYIQIKRVINSLREGKKPEQLDFDFACHKYKETHINELRNKTLGTGVITAFGKAKVFPNFSFKTTVKDRKRKADRGRKPSLAEAQKKDQAVVSDILREGALKRKIEVDKGRDTKLFVNSIIAERNEDPDLPENLVDAIKAISDKRLLDIRKEASEAFDSWRAEYIKAQSLLLSRTDDIEIFLDAFDEYRNGEYSLYPKEMLDEKYPQETLLQLMIIIRYRYNNNPPKAMSDNQFWRRQYRKVGGVEAVRRALGPTREAVSGALSLYLAESGANVAVGQILTVDRIKKSSLPNHARITGNKDRAKGKNIFDDLPNKINEKGIVCAVDALSFLSSELKKLYPNKKESELSMFAHTFQGEFCNGLTEFGFRDNFKAICNNSEYLTELNIVPSMLRPTVLLKAQLDDPTNAALVMMKADHEDEDTTYGYTNKLPYRVVMEEHMMKYMNSLETLMMEGTSKSDDKSIDELKETGLGVFCRDRTIIDEDGNQTQCNEVQDCVRCKQDRMLVIADEESISQMVIWKHSLDKHEEDFVAKNPGRWEKIWTPWQAFFNVVIEEKMTRGKLSLIKKEAVKLAEKKMKDEKYVMPEPW